MKTVIFCLLAMFLAVSSSQAASDDQKEVRFGLKGGIIYPISNASSWAKMDVMTTILEFDIKRSSQLDTGFRIGFDAFASDTSTFRAYYNVYQLGYGARYYFDERKSPEPNDKYYTFNRYMMIDGNIIMTSKYQDFGTDAPQNYYGVGIKMGAGLEYIMGPLGAGFVSLEYMLTNLKTSNGAYELPFQGLQVAFGIRLAKLGVSLTSAQASK